MGNMEIITMFVVALNVLMWISGLAMLDVNPSGTLCYNVEGTVIDNTRISSGNYSVLDNDVINDLPENQAAVTTGTTNIFTDVFNNILSWFKSAPGLKYIYGVVAAPYNILKCMNLPNAFVVAVGTLWYLISLLVLVAFIGGR
jgi:hypothetical protein